VPGKSKEDPISSQAFSSLKNFILEEEGRISKQAVLKLGAALALSSALVSQLADAQCRLGSKSQYLKTEEMSIPA
jgi:hypothetical protein